MVNLLLVGKAVPHVFDGTKELDGLTLNGISCSTEVRPSKLRLYSSQMFLMSVFRLAFSPCLSITEASKLDPS